MRLTQYIEEMTFSKNIPVKVLDEKGDRFRTQFEIDGVSYLFAATLLKRKSDEWDIIFVPVDSSALNIQRPTKRMDAIKVFSAVAKSLDMFLKRYNPNTFKFSPADAKLEKMYKRIAPKLAISYSQYDYSTDPKGLGSHVYTLKK